jgi:cation-transporting ATPase E
MASRAALAGLDAAEVAERVAAGQVNDAGRGPSRTVAQILRANILTRFNAILGAFFVVILLVGPLQDALFGAVLVANSAIGIIQELRAKRTLDRLSVLNAPRARVRRAGKPREIPATEIVLGDLVQLQPGDQVVVDGEILEASGLEVDESLLSGEAEPVGKGPGSWVLSGSFVTAGRGFAVATRVGRDAYAARLAEQAKRYAPARSEIRDAINRLLTWITWALIPAAALLLATQLASGLAVAEALRGSVAGVVGMVPEGLVLLTSVALAAGVVRLAARRVLVQEMPAIEGLARVDVLCCDKTGTLTQGPMRVAAVRPVPGPAGNTRHAAGNGQRVGEVLGALAAADPRPNATLRAVAARFGDPGWRAADLVPFSSARKWSAARFGGRGAWVLGAPEIVLATRPNRAVLAEATRLAGRGYRVLVLARSPVPPRGEDLPDELAPVALITLEEQIRPDAAATLRYFAAQDVTVKVVSGDHPATVAAIARMLQLPGAGHAVDARDLPADPDRLAEAVAAAGVIGRVAPHQKQAIIKAMQARGHVVAMTGDGVNDVLALKDSDVGIAMGSGTAASRGVAQLVLLDDAFAALPGVIGEGRRIIANVDRVSRLFLTKTTYVLLLAIMAGASAAPFPFYPRHLTVISTLTIGVPAFFLALAPNADRVRPAFLGRALRFAVPAGTVIAAASFGVFLAARGHGLSLPAARTVATVVTAALGLGVLAALARPLRGWRGLLVLAMAGAFAGLFAIPWLRGQLALRLLPAPLLGGALGVAAAGMLFVLLGWQLARRVFANRAAG